MSRIGKRPIPLPGNVEFRQDGATVVVKGPRGELTRTVPEAIEIRREDGTLVVARPDDAPQHRALHGLTRTLVANMVTGVSEGFTKTLDIQGVGYRAQKQGESLQLALGFSHPVMVAPPAGITFDVEGQNRVHVRGTSKELVGQTAANIRAIRPPEPYKGKGVRYLGEVVRRKAGKAGKGARK
jgi:large subunit ribosomal protein L6